MSSVGRLKLPHDAVDRERLFKAVDAIRRSGHWEHFVEYLIEPNMDAELEVLESQADEKLIFRAQGRRTAMGDILKVFSMAENAIKNGKKTF
jgi:hypothetical protein